MGIDFLSLANPGLQVLQPYQAGKPIEELERELGIQGIVKLASNENPLGLSEKAKQAIQAHLEGLTLYPDSNGFYLKQQLAAHFGVDADQITLGNGSNDLLELIARTFVRDGDEVIYAEYAFIVYALVTQALNAKAVEVPAKDWGHDLSAMLAAITDKTRLIFIANPNNPTGTFLSSQALESFLCQVPEHVIVVLDEAYTEYTPESLRAPSFQWIQQFPNLVVCRTFSKAFGLAGLRIGYCVSHMQMADLFNRLRQPFNCNSLALVAAQAVLNDMGYLNQSVTINQEGMQSLISFCDAQGLDYIPSMGNFLTVDMGRPALPVYEQLLRNGVIVRPLVGYGMPNHLRISIGLPQENQRLIAALKTILAS